MPTNETFQFKLYATFVVKFTTVIPKVLNHENAGVHDANLATIKQLDFLIKDRPLQKVVYNSLRNASLGNVIKIQNLKRFNFFNILRSCYVFKRTFRTF